jgi:ppGpp synthetase/RelA/SpoT-type nucleotidyltranferase
LSISEETIARTIQRYQREYDRYLKLAARVAEICRSEIVEGNAIRAQVTSRAKSPKSLEGKLRREALKGKDYADEDEVFQKVRDLAAVRVATYEQGDETGVVEEICKRFAAPGQPPIVPDVKDKLKEKKEQTNFYRATHCEVFLPQEDLVGTYANVANVPCEIQVCSMMSHVWNEIEHDLGYKPMSGTLSGPEQAFLVMLGHTSRSGDGIITQLLAATDARQAEREGPFADVYDFVARLRKWFPGTDFGRHAGQLFEELQSLRILSPSSVERLVGKTDGLGARALADLQKLAGNLTARGDVRYTLDESSSDLLLVALLPPLAKHLAKSRPTGRGVGGPTRLAWIAARYLAIEEEASLSASLIDGAELKDLGFGVEESAETPEGVS